MKKTFHRLRAYSTAVPMRVRFSVRIFVFSSVHAFTRCTCTEGCCPVAPSPAPLPPFSFPPAHPFRAAPFLWQIEDYVHRIGRTGRAGNDGNATAFMTPKDARLAKDLEKILSDAHQEIPGWLEEMAKSARFGGGGGYGGRGGGGRYGGGGGGGGGRYGGGGGGWGGGGGGWGGGGGSWGDRGGGGGRGGGDDGFYD
jgi:hypothetical protein